MVRVGVWVLGRIHWVHPYQWYPKGAYAPETSHDYCYTSSCTSNCTFDGHSSLSVGRWTCLNNPVSKVQLRDTNADFLNFSFK